MIVPILIGDLKGRKIKKLKIDKKNEKYLQFSEKIKRFSKDLEDALYNRPKDWQYSNYNS